jgi:chromate transporter
MREIFGAFLRLGLTSFGGPVAHIGYFRTEFVERRRWLDEATFAQLLSIAQFLPGPASSQLGFGIGVLRGGWRGGLTAFLAFTLPSALFLGLVAVFGTAVLGGGAVLHGLKLVAVVVVADGVWRMGRQLTPDATRLAIAAAAVAGMLLLQTAWMQLVVIGVGAVAGTLVVRLGVGAPPAALAVRHGRRSSLVCISIFALLLIGALAWTPDEPSLFALAGAFWRAGALVFGGGHVVLPLLESSVVAPGWVSNEAFLAGYGAAQAVPGPMFSLASYLGAIVPLGLETALAPFLGALVATLAVFAPGFLLYYAILPGWSRLSAHPGALTAIAGANAAVVGLLAAALYDPVLKSGIVAWPDAVVAVIGLVLHTRLSRPTLVVVAWCIGAALLLR